MSDSEPRDRTRQQIGLDDQESDRELAEHDAATDEFLTSLAFRFRHVTEHAPPGFGDHDVGAGVRTPKAIVVHMTGLIGWVLAQVAPDEANQLAADHDQDDASFEEACERFLTTVEALRTAWPGGLHPEAKLSAGQIWRGPLTDAMTHVGQLATLRRLAGHPVERVRYWQVEM